ncbi:MAG TPA: hypothetical protein VGF47_10365 [Solirubrobacteraceae bacterium]|jgi:hypothetical protein
MASHDLIRALERERRRVAAEKDVEILTRTGPDPELAGLAEYAASVPASLRAAFDLD